MKLILIKPFLIKPGNLYYALAISFLLLLSSGSYANTSLEHFGFVQTIEDSGNADDLKKLRVSGKNYIFDWSDVRILYKGVYVNISDLEKGMKIKFKTQSDTSPEKISVITILSEHPGLLNH